MKKMLDLYRDYLLSSFNQTTATGLSKLTDGRVSHDKVSKFLNHKDYSSKELCQEVKSFVRKYENEDGCLIFDDTIINKPHTDESALITWHYDHSIGKSVKGINLITAFYCNTSLSDKSDEAPIRLPVSYMLVLKTIVYCVVKTKKVKRKSEMTKNEMMRQMILQSIHNQLKFKYILADSWFASADNMRFIKKKKKYFIFDMKTNRNAVLSEQDRNKGLWSRIDKLDIPDNTPVEVWLKDLEFSVLLIKQVLKNKDGSTGVRFLFSNDFSLTKDHFSTIYKKRWSVEEYHKSLKQNASIAKSPTIIIRTQSNHIFAACIAYFKLEKLKLENELNHFSMKSKIYVAALKAAFKELNILKGNHDVA